MSSVDVMFTKPTNIKGKAFARKRPNKDAKKPASILPVDASPMKSKQVEAPSPSPKRKAIINSKAKIKAEPQPIFNKEKETELSAERNKSPVKEQLNRPDSSYVKRKQKKDKAKALTNDGEKASAPQSAGNFQKQKGHSLFAVHRKDVYINTHIPGKSVVEKVFSSEQKFSSLDIHKYLVSNLEKHSFTTLTTVQEKSMPHILSGKNVLVRSQTGSGKTIAYAAPIINALQGIDPRIQRSDGVQAVVVVPTRELALQTHELFSKLCTFQWIVIGHLCGGENRNTEKTRLRKGVHVLIATPGRLLDHVLHTNALKLDNVRCLVLDEADRLLDMGFKKDIIRIVEELDRSKVNAEYNPMEILKKGKSAEADTQPEHGVHGVSPLKDPSSKSRQTILLSATLNEDIAELANFTMKNHIYVDALEETGRAKVNPGHMVIPNTVKQEFILTYVKHRLFTLSAILLSKAAKSKVFVFMATSQMVDYHHELFTKYLMKMPRNRGKLKSGDVVVLDGEFDDSDDEEDVVIETDFFKLHGSMDQAARKQVFTAFRKAKRGVLLCTDVAARGIDVAEADCIIQYTGPQSDEDYLHRVGRTGRAGKSGYALIFLTHEEQEYVTRLQEHKVFLKERKPDEFLKHLCDVMDEPDQENAATALQRRFESAVAKDSELHRMASFAYSSWSRFYNTYPGNLRSVFDFKKVNLGHYVTSFALQETPSSVAKTVRGQVATVQPRRLNKKLANHSEEQMMKTKAEPQKRKIKSISLATSEFSSGIEPSSKKRKK